MPLSRAACLSAGWSSCRFRECRGFDRIFAAWLNSIRRAKLAGL
jgi:hypothetical protein